jgi:hypothetical protein
MGRQAPSPLYATAVVTDNIVFTIVTLTRTTRLPTRFAVSVTVPRTNAIAAIDDDNVIARGAPTVVAGAAVGRHRLQARGDGQTSGHGEQLAH